MPRTRRVNVAREVTPAPQAPQQDTVNNTTQVTTQKEVKIMALTPDQIQALLGKARSKGVYEEHLVAFVKSGEQGVCVNETWVDMADKKATTLKQGFEGAKEKKSVVEALPDFDASTLIKVITSDEKVYLINLQAAGVAAAGAQTEPAAA